MARHTVIHLTDDIDGSDATQTVHFAYKGKTYSLDLNDTNAAELDEVLAPYVAAAEKAGAVESSRGSGRRRAAAPARKSPTGTDEVHPAKVRAWAEANDVKVSRRGRIAASVLERYRAATG